MVDAALSNVITQTAAERADDCKHRAQTTDDCRRWCWANGRNAVNALIAISVVIGSIDVVC